MGAKPHLLAKQPTKEKRGWKRRTLVGRREREMIMVHRLLGSPYWRFGSQNLLALLPKCNPKRSHFVHCTQETGVSAQCCNSDKIPMSPCPKSAACFPVARAKILYSIVCPPHSNNFIKLWISFDPFFSSVSVRNASKPCMVQRCSVTQEHSNSHTKLAGDHFICPVFFFLRKGSLSHGCHSEPVKFRDLNSVGIIFSFSSPHRSAPSSASQP